jgi:hypothetical protein
VLFKNEREYRAASAVTLAPRVGITNTLMLQLDSMLDLKCIAGKLVYAIMGAEVSSRSTLNLSGLLTN